MMRDDVRPGRRPRPMLLMLLGALLLAPGPAAAQQPAREWDQNEATLLAVEIDRLLGEIEVTMQAVQALEDHIKRREGFAAMEDLSALKDTAARLASMLKSGMGRMPTDPVFRRMTDLRGSLSNRSQRAGLNSAAAMDNIVEVRIQLDKLRGFYE